MHSKRHVTCAHTHMTHTHTHAPNSGQQAKLTHAHSCTYVYIIDHFHSLLAHAFNMFQASLQQGNSCRKIYPTPSSQPHYYKSPTSTVVGSLTVVITCSRFNSTSMTRSLNHCRCTHTKSISVCHVQRRRCRISICSSALFVLRFFLSSRSLSNGACTCVHTHTLSSEA